MSHYHPKKIIVIVSGYSSGANYAPAFISRGYKCIHVTTRREWNLKAFNVYYEDRNYIENIILDDENNIDALLKTLQQYDVKCILPGCEPGVELADKLSAFFPVAKNDLALTTPRRNKYEMIETIKKNNLLHAQQIKSSRLEDILSWRKDKNFSRIVIKPISSGSSDSVFYCDSEEEVANAFNTIIGKKNRYDQLNQEVLAQEHLVGPEYIVNTVSKNGKHVLVDVWRGYSENTNLVSNDIYADVVTEQSEIDSLFAYTRSVLDALGIKNGPAHSEIRLTNKGPCLIEIAARLAGKTDFSAVTEIYGFTQLSLTVDAILDESIFDTKLNEAKNNKPYARYVYFASKKTGLIVNEPDLLAIKKLKTFHSMVFDLEKGQMLYPTSRSLRRPRPGYAYLIGNKQDVENDYLQIRQLEQALYEQMLAEQK